LNRMLIRVEREATVSDNAKSVVDLLVTRMQGIGGGSIRPWMAVWVENGSATPGVRDAFFARPGTVASDRLTYAVLVPEAPTCAITAATATTVTSPTTGGCCLQQMFTPIAGLDPETPSQITVFVTNGERHRQLVLNPPTLATCTSTVSAGPLSAVDTVTTAQAALLSGGSVSRARIKTLYLNSSNELREFERFGTFPVKPTLEAGDSTLVSSDVFDLEFQLGYDTSADGRITDNGSSTDEWLYNNNADVASGFSASTLRMVGVGVVVGTRTPEATRVHTARVAGGELIGSRYVFMRSAAGRAALRNLFVFN
ncbi:MAG TPA: hypothetical protein VGF99_15755, partial [Myxococcota bacterium]